MSDFIKFNSVEMGKDCVQSLMQAKQFARSLENFVDALIPMIENPDTAKILEDIRENAAKAGGVLQRIYNRNAREFFGVGVNGPNLASGRPAALTSEGLAAPSEGHDHD